MVAQTEVTALPPEVWLVEDDPALRVFLARALRRRGAHVTELGDGADLVGRLGAGGPLPDVVVTDQELPRLNGLDALREARKAHPELRALLITGLELADLGIEPARLGIPVLRKPFAPEALWRRLEATLRG